MTSTIAGTSRPCTIRPATPADAEAILALAAHEGMELSSTANALVAEGSDGALLGFLRIVRADGADYICPIVTAPDARGSGIGTALIRAAQNIHPELRLVARGYAVPFYTHLGAKAITWNDIAPIISADCENCERRDTCKPQPMVLRSPNLPETDRTHQRRSKTPDRDKTHNA